VRENLVPLAFKFLRSIESKRIFEEATSMSASDDPNHLAITAEIVSAFVGNNSVPRSDLPAMIDSVRAALRRIDHCIPPRLIPHD
jgi:hypothetical protein